jgi:hypothetical protein
MITLTALLLLILTGCSGVNDKTLIVTVVRSKGNPDYLTGASWRFPSSAYIASVDRENTGEKPRILTEDFFSAAFAEVSYDGKKILFAGKLREEDPWQIYEMTIGSRKYRRLTSTAFNCTDPAYLPAGRFVFSMAVPNDTTGLCHSIFTSKLSGGEPARITWHPHADFASMVMSDGRIVTVTRQVYPEPGTSNLFVLRPDGTKAMMHIPSQQNEYFTAQAAETADGKMLYLKMNSETGQSKLWSVKLSRPLHTAECISEGDDLTYGSVAISNDGTVFVTCGTPANGTRMLCEFDPASGVPGKTVFESDEGYIAEAAVAEAHQRPKNLPSEVDMHVKTGQMMCQDINHFGPETFSETKAARIEILGIGKSLGIVETEADGSFYIKPLSDMPFRIRTVDKDGKELNGPTGWMWLRPNERRGCVGCHEDPETVPDNRVPMAVKKNPAIVPVHIDKVKEKSVELE